MEINFEEFLKKLDCNLLYIAERNRDANPTLRRSAFLYYMNIHMRRDGFTPMDVYKKLAKVINRSPNNILEQIYEFESNFEKNIEKLNLQEDDFIPAHYSVGDVVKLKSFNWYRNNMNKVLVEGIDSSTCIRYDGSVFFSIKKNTDSAEKISFCGKPVTIKSINYSKGIPKSFSIKEDKGKNKYSFNESDSCSQ